MKARIKATGEIVDVVITQRVTNTGEEVYMTDDGRLIEESRLELNVDDKPDYWTRLEHQAAIAAMGGICGNTSYDESTWEEMAEDAILAAHFFVQKLKEKEERKCFG